MLDDVVSFEFSDDSGAFRGVAKDTLVLWGNREGMSSPLCYMHKPKSLSDEDWTIVRAALREAIVALPLHTRTVL